MSRAPLHRALLLTLSCLAVTSGFRPGLAEAPPAPLPAAAAEARAELLRRHGEAEAARIERGLRQVLSRWRPSDGDAAALNGFVLEQFVPRGAALDDLLARLEFALERMDGFAASLARDLRRGVDLDLGPQLTVDGLLAAYDPSAHTQEDLFTGKLAFVALLNFPDTTLEERARSSAAWSRRDWAETRLAGRFGLRVPAEVNQSVARALAAADQYISGYNIRMHHVLTADGRRSFPAGKRLITHWNLRDEIKALYGEKDGLTRQRLVQRVMERIVRQEIPAAVIDDPRWDWSPETNAVAPAAVPPDAPLPSGPPADRAGASAREPDRRYAIWLANFAAVRAVDAYDPLYKDAVARSFARDREIPEAEVVALFEAVLKAPAGRQVGALIARRLGRPLEPFDIWYAGFKPGGSRDEKELDALTRRRYPTPQAFEADIPRLLQALGFDAQKAAEVARRIVVDPSRGAGHAFGPARRDDDAHLRTRVGPGGMDYKGYNIAVHELGHNVEQVFSTIMVDHTLLRGVPNNAFTEAMAFLFQARDLELLGLDAPDASARPLEVLNDFWGTREIAAVALVDIRAWHWLYDHPQATPAQFREAVVGIAQEVWNTHFAPVFGVRDVPLLGVYSHLVSYPLYTPDYPLGHLIAFQVGEHFRTLKGTTFGSEFERITKLGSIAPDAWMRSAVGAPLSAQPLIDAATRAAADLSKP